MKPKGYRHGDLAFIQIDKLPEGLKESKTNIILQTGSGGNPHSFKGGKFYPKQESDYIIGCLETKDTILYHPEHGDKKIGAVKEAKIKDGIYEIRRQVEKTHEGMRPVVD